MAVPPARLPALSDTKLQRGCMRRYGALSLTRHEEVVSSLPVAALLVLVLAPLDGAGVDVVPALTLLCQQLRLQARDQRHSGSEILHFFRFMMPCT